MVFYWLTEVIGGYRCVREVFIVLEYRASSNQG